MSLLRRKRKPKPVAPPKIETGISIDLPPVHIVHPFFSLEAFNGKLWMGVKPNPGYQQGWGRNITDEDLLLLVKLINEFRARAITVGHITAPK